MPFQIGKYYQHTGGEMMSIVGSVITTAYGKTLVAERNNMSNLTPIGHDEDAMQNWSEITKGKWLSNFSREDNLPPSFTEKLLRFGIVQESGHYYPPMVVVKELVDIDKNKRSIVGTFGMPHYDPNNPTIDSEHISHYVHNLRIENNDLLGDIYITNTPRGKELWEFMQENEVAFKLACLLDTDRVENGVGYVSRVQILGIHAVPKLPEPVDGPTT